jgi:hypothetical protein
MNVIFGDFIYKKYQKTKPLNISCILIYKYIY